MKSTLAVSVTILLLLFAGDARGEVHRWMHADCYIPDGLAPDAVVPVLVVEKGLAEENAKLVASLAERVQCIVVQYYLRERIPEGSWEFVRERIEIALGFAARHHRVERCPWVLLAFSATARRTALFAFQHPDRYQGLLIVNPRMQAESLPTGMGKAKDLSIALLHGSEDPVCKPGWAEGIRDRLIPGDFRSLAYKRIETRDHMAPLGEKGASFIAEFLKGFKTDPIAGRELQWFSPKPRTEKTETAGKIQLTADIYETGSMGDPVLLLFHQAGSSRGEYLGIAPRLVKAGYNCIAFDQRSGNKWGPTVNQTAQAAAEAKLGQAYEDAKPDLERGIAWARELGFSGKLALWGSSYSASLVLFVGGESEEVSAVVSFSPGDYLKPRGSVFEAARALTKPTLLVCPPREERQSREVRDEVAAEDKEMFVQPEGMHGSSTLYRTKTSEEAWKAVLTFLAKHLR